MLRTDGTNTAGWTFWKLTIPDEAPKAGLEVGVHTDVHGLCIGDGHITWDDLDAARARLSVIERISGAEKT